MNQFTDEDLKRLKQDVESWMSAQFPLGIKEVKALLTRLECAEAWALSSLRPHDESCAVFDRGNYCDCSIKKLEQAWRLAKGS